MTQTTLETQLRNPREKGLHIWQARQNSALGGGGCSRFLGVMLLFFCLPSHSAWPMSAFHRAVTAPNILQRWCPQLPSQMQCSQTACPTHSTWLSSKPRLPVPKTFTLPCWTVPTKSRARLPHPRVALEAAFEVLGEGWTERMNYIWPKAKQWLPFLICPAGAM